MWSRNGLFFAAMILAVALVAGCGGSTGSGGTTVTVPGPDNIQLLGITNCAVCHDANSPPIASWLLSRHANGNNVPDTTDPTCLACHDQLGDGQLMDRAFTGEANRPIISCESCHGGGGAHRGIGLLPYPVPGPAQCGQCHGVEAALFHSDRIERLISDTHFDNPATGFIDASSNVSIEGYVVKVNDQRGCQACHFNGHNPTKEYNTAWANSAHGGHLLAVKDAVPVTGDSAVDTAARTAAAVTDADAPAWTHYNWDQTTGTGNRASCQRCHTATGIANFLTDPAAYDPTTNNFSHLSGWTAATGSPQNEMLYCWGCHADNTGALRDPGAITADYTGAAFTYPDVANSNVCLACHTGRESGGTIAALAVSSATNWGDLGFINSHYLTAGGQVFSASGYHYAGLEYATPANLHPSVGTADSVGTAIDTNGPCAKCHMSTAGVGQSHSFAVVATDGAGLVTAINPTFCTACHIDALALAPADLNTLSAGIDAALEALLVQLTANGFPFQEEYPYFAARNWGDATTGPNNMGAAFNYNLLVHDPGAYAHNVRYAQRLIWDSIDWLDNNILDDSTVTTINALAGLEMATRDAALAWLGAARP